VDSRVVHGIPSKDEILREGSIISLDCVLSLDGWLADSALTVPVGEVSQEKMKLIRTTEACFFAAARQARAGATLGDIGAAIAATAHQAGCTAVRDLTGHGIGRGMHEDPTVYNYGQPGHGAKLRAGMTLAIEPMIALGGWRVDEEDDGWGIVTRDGSPASHYEHTVAITDGLPEILTLPGFAWREEA
jgi:methionyl aminopeptidase